ncbi:formylglycine-generating enzyme family protein [Terricaulis sp.]|uniref:formylglycine-generating enzyme family protein n=1 Tax=Terricaulis sp. TaxID=2768686 RepID=UPI00378430AE
MQRWFCAAIVGAWMFAAPAMALAQTLAPGQVFDDCDGADWCPRMVVMPAGDFQMGSSDSETGRDGDEGPQHRVWLRPFAVGKFEVTFAQWDACVDAGACEARDDASWGRGDRPVINVSWNDAQNYVQWLSARTGKHYRLLTESEWEYAARAGRTTPFATGLTIRPNEANYATSGYRETRAVGSYAPNAFGLYDMHGNVSELVQDCFQRRYWHAPTNGAAIEHDACYYRIARGGAWSTHVSNVRVANRIRLAGVAASASVGFRVARDLD